MRPLSLPYYSLSNTINRKDRGKPFRVYVTEQFVQSVHMTAQACQLIKTAERLSIMLFYNYSIKDYEAITVQKSHLADVALTFYMPLREAELLPMNPAKNPFTTSLSVLSTSLHKTT